MEPPIRTDLQPLNSGRSTAVLIPRHVEAVLDLRETVLARFPRLWRPVELGSAAVACLLLADSKDVVNLVLVGAPSGEKTTAVNIFDGGHWAIYRSDSFTTKAFVSHHAGTSKDALAGVDLLPRIRGRVLITPELAPMLRGRHDDLQKDFGTIARVLDGDGYKSDSGVHGQRGYEGDYFFVWLGATTPLPSATWEVMAQLGSRLMFCPMTDGEPTDEELIGAITRDAVYLQNLGACRTAMRRALDLLLPDPNVARSLRWDNTLVPLECADGLQHLARIMARLRGVVPVIARGPGNRPEFGPAIVEKPHRALQGLFKLAQGRAILFGRAVLTVADVAAVVPVALGSCRTDRRILFQQLMDNHGGVTPTGAAGRLRVATETARSLLRELEALEVVECVSGAGGDSYFLPEPMQWFLGPRFGKLLQVDLDSLA